MGYDIIGGCLSAPIGLLNRKAAEMDILNTKMAKRCIVGCAALAALCALADGDPYANYVKLGASDAVANYSWNAAGNWDDGEPPSSDKNYYVPAGKTLIYFADKNIQIDISRFNPPSPYII